jgi:hypothetical protein
MNAPVMTQAEAVLQARLSVALSGRSDAERLAAIAREHVDRLLVALYALSFPLLGDSKHGEVAGKAHDIAVEIEDFWSAEESADDDE